MAKQMGPYQFTGTLGGVTGYKRNGKYFVKGQNMVSRERVLTSPDYARTRENSWEFKHATRSSMLVRRVLWPLTKLMKLADSHLSPRVNGLCTQIIRTDRINGRGERRMDVGELELLEDFAFQREKTFGSVCRVMTSSRIDTTTGMMQCTVSPFDPQTRLEAPEGATHFQFVANGGAINFDTASYHFDYKESAHYPLDAYMEEAIRLEQTLRVQPGQVLLQAVGIVFFKQDAAGKLQRINGGVMRVMQVCVAESVATAVAAGSAVALSASASTVADVVETTNATASTADRSPNVLLNDPTALPDTPLFDEKRCLKEKAFTHLRHTPPLTAPPLSAPKDRAGDAVAHACSSALEEAGRLVHIVMPSTENSSLSWLPDHIGTTCPVGLAPVG